MRSLFLSHRGESDDAPENTLPAFQLAIDGKSDGIELDIHLTKDGHVVVVHDDDLLRVANNNIVIAESNLADIKAVHPVPTLKEFLSLDLSNMRVQIEIKGKPNLFPKFKELLEEDRVKNFDITISSFDANLLKEAKEVFPNYQRILLIDLAKLTNDNSLPSVEETINYLKLYDVTGISFKSDFRITKAYVDSLKAANFNVVAWGVFTDELGIAMAESGVEAMTCNHALALRKKYLSR